MLYIAFVALVQRDMKKLIAYSSIAHMGFVTLGMFIGFQIVAHTGRTTGIELGLDGAVVQMLSHGLVSGAMFLCVGVMYDRVHSREISAYGGVINTMPKFAAFMVLFALANSGLPGTSGFIGEFMVILAAFKANVWYAFLAATILVLGAAYTLWLIKRVIYGEVGNDKVAALTDLNGREFLVLGALAVAVLLVGLWPAPLLDVDARHHAAFGPAVAGLEDRSLGPVNTMDMSGVASPKWPEARRDPRPYRGVWARGATPPRAILAATLRRVNFASRGVAPRYVPMVHGARRALRDAKFTAVAAISIVFTGPRLNDARSLPIQCQPVLRTDLRLSGIFLGLAACARCWICCSTTHSAAGSASWRSSDCSSPRASCA